MTKKLLTFTGMFRNEHFEVVADKATYVDKINKVLVYSGENPDVYVLKNIQDVIDLGNGMDFDEINEEINSGKYDGKITVSYYKSAINSTYFYDDKDALCEPDII